MLNRFSEAFLQTFKFGARRVGTPVYPSDEMRAKGRGLASSRYAVAAVVLSVLGVSSTVRTLGVRDAETGRSASSQQHVAGGNVS